MQKELKRTIFRKIKKYDTIVIARHIGPDPDAICSTLALKDIILNKYPNKKVYVVGATVARFKKFGKLDKINNKEIKNALLITTDVPNLCRIDGVEDLKYVDSIKIDHHPYEDDFGGLDVVDTSASSASEILLDIFLNSPFEIPKRAAENLFLGIASDSDRFLISTTSTKTFDLVSDLIKKTGIDFTSLYKKLYERSIEEIRFKGCISSNLTITDNGLAYIYITDEILNQYKVDTATPSNMINDFNYIIGVYVWAFVTFDKKNNYYKVNIRSNGPIINEVASHYNGGGHKFASGARMISKEKVDELLNELDTTCKEYKKEF